MVVVALTAFAAAGCTESAPETGTADPPPEVTGPRNGGQLVVALADDTANWSPAAAPWTSSQFEVGRSLYDRLAVYTDDHQLVPELAESIRPNDDFTEWTITLRADIVFHDGSPLDAAVLQSNLEAQQLSPVAGPTMAPVRSVFATGPRTVRVSMRAPWSSFPHLLTTQAGFVASVATLTTPEGAARPVGTGPFVFDAASPGESLDVTKNSSYWRDGLPRLDAVSFRVLSDGGARVDALSAGRVDMILADDPRTISELRVAADGPEPVDMLLDVNAEAPKLTFVFNTARPPFLDPVARNAVFMATDRAAMSAAGYEGLLVPAKGPVSDQSVWFIDQSYPPRDLARAREDAERYTEIYGEPLAFSLDVPREPEFVRFAGLWQQQLREAGIVVTIEIGDQAAIRLATAIGDFQAAMLPMFGQWHPDLYYPVFHQAQMTPPGAPGLNYARYGNVAIDDALDDARESGELATQVDRYRSVQNQLAAGQAYLFLLRLPQAIGLRPDVRDLTAWTTASGGPGLAQEHGTVSLTFAWLDRDEVTGD
jgi:peptide/nickel transport system substrate-binding protein